MNWLQRFMMGRYGMDQLGRTLTISSLILLFITAIFRLHLLNLLVLFLLVFSYFRMFSRNFPKRQRENEVYLQYESRVKNWFWKKRRYFQECRTYRHFKCPKCSQKIRIPKGKGRISITCPKCQTQFTKKT